MLSIQTSIFSAQPLRTSNTTATVLRSSAILTRRSQTRGQVRGFQFGLWSSYLDRNFEKECRRRHRVAKHKHIEALIRKVSWDRHLPGHPKTYGFKGFMCSAWHHQDSRPGGRWVNVDELRTPREESVSEPSAGTSTSRMTPLDYRIRRLRYSIIENLRRRREDLNSSADQPLTESNSSQTSSPSRVSVQSGLYGDEGFRRRFQARKDSNELEYVIDPITNRKVYKNTPREATDTGYDSVDIPVKTFKGYRSQFQAWEPPASAPGQNAAIFSQSSASAVQPSDPVQEGLKAYDSKVDYANGGFYDVSRCAIDYSEPTQAGLKDHDEKLSRKVCEAGPNTYASSSQNLTELATQDPNEVHKAIRHYDYAVTRPNGLVKAIEEYEAKRPKFLNSFFSGSQKTHPLIQAIQDFERSKLDLKNQNSNEDILDPLLKSIQDYQRELQLEKTMTERSGGIIDKQLSDVMKPIDEYRRSVYRAQLLHGSVEDALREYDSKTDYSRGRRNGNLNRSNEDTTEDLDLLRASDIRAASGILKNASKESEAEKSKKRKELEHAFNLSETSDEELAVFNEVKESRCTNLDPDVALDSVVESSGPSRDKDAQSLGTSSDHTPRNLTGNFVRDFPEEFETKWRERGSGTLMPESNSANSNGMIKQRTTPSYAIESSGHGGNPNVTKIETSLDRTVQQPAKGDDRTAPVLQSKGNLSASVSSYGTPKGSGAIHELDLLRNDVQRIYEDEYGVIDENHRQVSDMPSAQEKSSSNIQKSAKEKSERPEPTLYKILAYDPIMQTVSTAETTSIVDDVSAPLTPAEVLLRLSNPAKFFPHFQPLQSQGYEIASGSGDVLVFRKVRSAAPRATESQISYKTETVDEDSRRRSIDSRNPIDGMQGSPFATTGDFASPTGFVNHDLPRGSDLPFKSNIDVRREEPVFSGKSNWQGERNERPRKKGRAKKVLLSAFWVAGCCYAVGVVAEFFKTGGMDGSGVTGF